MLVAVVLSTPWLDLPGTSAGAFTSAGLVFIAFLYSGFQTFSEFAGSLLCRPVVNKHQAYAFYRPSALWIAQIFVDMAFQSVQIIAFLLMVYCFLGGMCLLMLAPPSFFICKPYPQIRHCIRIHSVS